MQYKKISDFPNITTVGSGVYLPAVDPSESLAINQNKKIRVADFLDNYQGFTQSGSGAVSRTVSSKLKDVVSVKDFGAVGDGVTNDTTAIDNASAASPICAEVPISNSTYKHTDTAFTLTGNFSGYGQIQTSDGKRGNNVRRLTTAPSPLTLGGGLNSFFQGPFPFPDN